MRLAQGQTLPHALTYARSFFCVVPTLDGIPVGGWGDASRHLPEVEWLFRRRHDGIGIATGEASGCWAMVINRLEGRRSLRTLIERYEPLPFGPVMATADSWVWWFSWEPACIDLQDGFEFAPGLMVRSDGGGLVVPPGSSCRWRDVSITDTEPARAPQWLLGSAVVPEAATMAVGL